jgi:hemolysin activation/secretion protein
MSFTGMLDAKETGLKMPNNNSNNKAGRLVPLQSSSTHTYAKTMAINSARPPHMSLTTRVPTSLVLALPLLCAAAENVPNAGGLLQTVPAQPPQRTAPGGSPLPAIRPEPQAAMPDTTPFVVRQFRIEGNTVFDTATLQALLASMQDKRLTLPQIAEGIEAITTYYRAAGYPLARTIIPAQTIEDGVVSVQVIEANWGQMEVRNSSAVQDAVLMRTLSDLEKGSVIRLDAMERATLLLSDLPGVLPRALLRAGQEFGSSDLVVEVQPGAAWSASLSADNFGSRYTGVARSNANVQFNNPLGQGDTLGLNSLNSEGGGLKYVRLAYEVPVLAPGVQAGVDSSAMKYRLGDTAASLLAFGEANTSGVWLRGALLRSPGANLNARLGFSNRVLQDHVDSMGEKNDRTLNVWSLELSGERQDAWLGGGKNTLGLALYSGRVAFDDAAAAAQDASAANTAGGFARATWALSRTQALGAGVSAVLSTNGQWAQKNLDNGQKFSVGGANSVRAYRSGVLSGDIGVFGSLELRYALSLPPDLQPTGNWQVSAFVDGAKLHTNKNSVGSGSNKASLSGAGLGLNWQGPQQWRARITYARSLGKEPSQLTGSSAKQSSAWVELGTAF